jgi:hypothetical protein
MTRDTMFNLDLQNLLRHTTAVLQFYNTIAELRHTIANNSTICPEGVLYYVTVFVDYWEYPTNFIVLRSKNKLSGYPLIMGRPWLATADAYISCR